jgi:hypothetical protein
MIQMVACRGGAVMEMWSAGGKTNDCYGWKLGRACCGKHAKHVTSRSQAFKSSHGSIQVIEIAVEGIVAQNLNTTVLAREKPGNSTIINND